MNRTKVAKLCPQPAFEPPEGGGVLGDRGLPAPTLRVVPPNRYRKICATPGRFLHHREAPLHRLGIED